MPTFHQNIIRHAKKKESRDTKKFYKHNNQKLSLKKPRCWTIKAKTLYHYFKYFQTIIGKYDKDALTVENISEGREIIKIPVLKSN